MVVETGLDVCVNKMAGTINKKMKNKILSLHAAWLLKMDTMMKVLTA
jgi:hypothetical protein